MNTPTGKLNPWDRDFLPFLLFGATLHVESSDDGFGTSMIHP